MKIYRIAKTEYCDTSGEGAKQYGGRWNLPGYAVLYGGSSISSALLERLTVDPELFSSSRYILYSVMEIDCPKTKIFFPALNDLPQNWGAIPPNKFSQEYGIKLIKSGVLCFAVPSVVDNSSLNFILNPLAGGFDKLSIKIYPLEIDNRLVN